MVYILTIVLITNLIVTLLYYDYSSPYKIVGRFRYYDALWDCLDV